MGKVALYLLLATATVVSLATNEVSGYETQQRYDVDASDWRRWLQDPETRGAFVRRWNRNGSPLQSALAALSSDDQISDECRYDTDTTNLIQSRWFQTMVDASVKVPEGLAALVTTHLGNWDECVNIRNKNSSDGLRTINGQMCMVNIRLGTKNDLSVAERLEEVRERVDNLPVSLPWLKMGVCVPSTCQPNDVQTLFKQMFDKDNKKKLQVVVKVEDKDCTTSDRPLLDTLDWFTVGLLTFLGAIVVLSTTYDVVVTSDQKKVVLFTAFSVYSNGQKLLAFPRAGGDQTLSCLHGIRFISMCWVVLAHRYMRNAGAPTINPLYRLEVFKDFWHLFLTNGTLSVDTFLVLSGLLVGYLFFNQTSSKRKLNIPMYYIHRYIRLTPALAMMVLLTASLMSKIGWGPLWSTTTDPERAACRENWWNTLLYVGNYVNAKTNCVSQSWYLMVDMQLHWLSPLVLLPLAKKPMVGLIWIGILMVGGIVALFVFFMVVENTADTMYFQVNVYFPTHMRFVPYLEGLLVGYYIGDLRSKNALKPLPIVKSLIVWMLAAALMLVPFLVYWEFLTPPIPSRVESAFYNALNRPSWSLGVALIVYLCASGNGGPVNVFLSWWGFQILGRLSYCVYLIHFGLQLEMIAATKTLTYLSDATVFPQFASDILISLILAGVLSLLCESPFLVLEKQLLSGGRRQKIEQPEATQETNLPSEESKEKTKDLV